ncbi:MAG: hypothetical protein RL562_879 [Planctomycetota bacterium]|jgi:regulator of sirC expression with transglutaminase-like and TPR domain
MRLVPAPAPVHCRPEAWSLLQDQLERIETPEGLLGGALALALHAEPSLVPERVEIELDRITESIRVRLHSDDPRAAVAHAHAVLFDELGFRGDTDSYYDPANSSLPQVLARRRGLPITLCLLYKLVVEPLGLEVDGLNAPGHFLVAVRGPAPFGRMIVDPFAAGRALGQSEALARVREISGTAFDGPLPVATHRQWLQRMLRNLVGSYGTRNQSEDRAAMEELLALLGA